MAFARIARKNYTSARLLVLEKFLLLLACSDSRYIPVWQNWETLGKIHALWMFLEIRWRFIEIDARNNSSLKAPADEESNLETWRHVEYYYYYSILRGCQSCMVSIY